MDLYTVRNNIMKGVPLQELNLRVCFYARVSTDKDEQLHSLQSQISFFNDYISKVPNWKFVGSYIDEGISGTLVKKREEFLKMIEDARIHKFDLILTKEISRFSRSTLDSIMYTQELLSNGVGVYFLNDNINTILPDSELRLTMMSSIAQDEVRRLSERVSFGMKRSIDNGVVLGCSNIYGYVKDKGKLVIDEEQAEMIKIIFDRYANTTDGLSKVSRYLYSIGYKSRTGKRIDTTILTRIIENPKYKGYTFKGWTDKHGKVIYNNALLEEDTTLYANWEKIVEKPEPVVPEEKISLTLNRDTLHVKGVKTAKATASVENSSGNVTYSLSDTNCMTINEKTGDISVVSEPKNCSNGATITVSAKTPGGKSATATIYYEKDLALIYENTTYTKDDRTNGKGETFTVNANQNVTWNIDAAVKPSYDYEYKDYKNINI